MTTAPRWRFVKPHVPFLAPKKHFDLYDAARVSLPPDFAPSPVKTGPAYRANFHIFVQREVTPELAREAIAGYYAATSFMDAEPGRVMAEVEKIGLRESTAIVVFSDHGFHLGEKGMWSKQTLFEASLLVPLIVLAPGLAKAGGVCPRPVELVDLYPTLAQLCGLPQPAGLEGRSLAPLLRNPSSAWDKPAYSFLRRGAVRGATVRTARYRYTEWDAGQRGAELYDELTDPGENRNRAEEAAQAAVVAEHRRLLEAATKGWGWALPGPLTRIHSST